MLWRRALKDVLDSAYKPMANQGAGWALIGSAASALQGADVAPNDLDLLAATKEGVMCFAAAMTAHTPPTCPIGSDDGDWFSSLATPYIISEEEDDLIWHFGRWHVDGFKVEMAHIGAPENHPILAQGIWEAGPGIWPHIYEVPFEQHQVPVVPLEIQVGTCLNRDLQARVDALLAVLKHREYNATLLAACVGDENIALIRHLELE